jgi:hypothetical protein
MKTKFDTSLNIDCELLGKIEYYEKVTKFTKQQIILKFLSHFIKKWKNGLFLRDRPTVLYQPGGHCYKKITLHLTAEEVELLKQIRLVTLTSVSFSLFIAMMLMGNKILFKAKNSNWARKILSNYNSIQFFPVFKLLINELYKNYHQYIQYQRFIS